MKEFLPDYRNLQNAAFNRKSDRLPLYEHNISDEIMETYLQKSFRSLIDGDYSDKKEYFRNYNSFFLKNGYDTVSFECCIGSAMPESGSLGGHKPGAIQNRADFERYPWQEIPELFFTMFSDRFRALRETLPNGMKAIGGPGNGIFECVQEITGYMNLCYIAEDDPELFDDLFSKVSETNFIIWERFMKEFSDIYCVMRFGDDLGFKSNTLIDPEKIRKNIIPGYKNIISLVHSYNLPFLYHSCGCIFEVMEDMIAAGINAKHSNEDQIAPFPEWVRLYGDKIGNFGGVDTNVLCQYSPLEIGAYIHDVLEKSKKNGGLAIGSGNSIPSYIPLTGYLAMVDTVREFRGDFK